MNEHLSPYDKKNFNIYQDAERVKSLHDLHILDTLPEFNFDKITAFAKDLFNVPIVLISLVDEKRQWFKSCIGLSLSETDRKDSFCSLTIKEDKLFIVNNADKDERVKDTKYVLNSPHIKFYAGYPIHNGQYRIGTLCIIDITAREFLPQEEKYLINLAEFVDNEIKILNYTTELNIKNNLLIKHNEFKNKMMAIINHDIINELSPAISLLPLYKLKPENNIFNLILNSITNVKEYANNIIDIYKNELGVISINKKPIKISDLLEKINTNNIQVKITNNYDLYCDEYKICRVLNNLISNSNKYKPKNGYIKLKIKKINEKIVFSIKDNGPGVLPDKINDLFCFNNVTIDDNNHNSIGIGLYSCKIIIQEHGGNIWYKTPKKSEGACFKFHV